jgi:hypothetical protein
LQHVKECLIVDYQEQLKTTDQKAEGTRWDHHRGYWMCETGMCQQVPYSMIAR